MSQIQEFDYSANLLRVVPWQYNDAERLLKWLQNKQDFFKTNSEEFWQNWQTNVFNIDTINEFGVSVWAIILDIPLLITQEAREANTSWGFGQYRKNFNNGNFNPGATQQNLTIEQKRTLLKMRYQQLISRGTIPEINKIMQDAWGSSGNVYCIDNEDMTISYVFEFEAEPWMIYAIETLDILPRPSAVDYNIFSNASWILETGSWNDDAQWIDYETWNDG